MHKKLYFIGLVLFLLIGGYIFHISFEKPQRIRAIGKNGEFSFSKEDVASCEYLSRVSGIVYVLKEAPKKEWLNFSWENKFINIMMDEEVMVEGFGIMVPITSGSFFVYGEQEKLYEFVAPMKCSNRNSVKRKPTLVSKSLKSSPKLPNTRKESPYPWADLMP